MTRTPGGFPGRLDNLIHHPRMRWIPRPLTSWVCDWMDHKLGMSWAQIRRARHGKLPGYTNQLDWRQIIQSSANSATSSIPGAVVHYKTGEKP